MTTSTPFRFAVLVAMALAASGCGIFKKSGPKTPVLGQRIPVLTTETDIQVDPAVRALPFSLPAPVANPAWSQAGGTATKSMGQLALGVADRVHLLPAVPRQAVPGLLAAADLSAIVLRDSPTFAGVLPSKIFEAMAMRVPILLGVRGEARALVERAGAGLPFEPGDPRDLVATLRTFAMLGSPGRRAMGEAARAHALTHHDRTRQAQQLAVFLERLGPTRRGG